LAGNRNASGKSPRIAGFFFSRHGRISADLGVKEEVLVSFLFRLVDEEGVPAPLVRFEDSTSPGFVPLWEAIGVYDALYNSDGKQARDISRAVAYGVDRLVDDTSVARLLPSTGSLDEAIRFLENIHRGCTIHPSALVETR
jgi:hypothetical protein